MAGVGYSEVEMQYQFAFYVRKQFDTFSINIFSFRQTRIFTLLIKSNILILCANVIHIIWNQQQRQRRDISS